jgi:pyruvate kinase
MYSQVFAEQKRMVKACNRAGKPVIVATQMLDSMIRNPRPTRAEVTDVGTAVLDGTDAVMLSGETAAGRYPVESIKAMRSVLYEADSIIDKSGKDAHIYDVLRQHRWNPKVLNTSTDPTEHELDAVAASACLSARNLGAKCIIVTTKTGRVARAVAGHRPTVPVLAFCTDPQVARRLQLHRAVIPILLQADKWDPWSKTLRFANLRAEAIRTAKQLALVKFGDRVVFVDRTAGKPGDMLEYAHNMKIVTVRQV